jgi:hypothetical protein
MIFYWSYLFVVHFNPPTVPTKRDLLCGAQSIIWNIDGGIELVLSKFGFRRLQDKHLGRLI